MKKYLQRLGKWWLQRLEEKSTYVGLSILAISLGHHVSPEILDAVTWWGSILATGLIAASEEH